MPFKHAPTQALVGRAVFVGSLRRAGKPPLIDTAAVETVGVVVCRMQAKPFAWMQKTTGHPCGRELEHAAAGVQRLAQHGGKILGFGKAGRNARCGRGHSKNPEKCLLKMIEERTRIPAGVTVVRIKPKTCKEHGDSCLIRVDFLGSVCTNPVGGRK